MKDYYFIQYEDGDTEFVHADRTCDDSFCVQAALNKTVSEAKNKNKVVKNISNSVIICSAPPAFR